MVPATLADLRPEGSLLGRLSRETFQGDFPGKTSLENLPGKSPWESKSNPTYDPTATLKKCIVRVFQGIAIGKGFRSNHACDPTDDPKIIAFHYVSGD